jgi:GT2 family glycosyltransferase
LDASVIILTCNGRKWLDGCLRSVLDQRGVEYEVILVINASTDGSAEFVRSTFPTVRILELADNIGFAAGNNAGAKIATGRLLAFLNDDTRADPGWLRALFDAFTSEDVALATSRIVMMDDPGVIDSAGDGYTRPGGAFKRLHGGPASAALDPREVFGACGAAFMIRRSVFAELGGFDGEFFIIYEDVDLSYRARLLGYRCVYVPAAVVEHAGSSTMGAESPRSVFFGQRNLEWVYVKNTPAPLLVRSLASHVVYDIAAGVYFARRRRFGAYLRGKLAALRGLPRALGQRRAIQASRRVEMDALLRMIDRDWIGIKRREKAFVASRNPM